MIKNYFKIAFRNLFKERLYSAINLFNLSVGIAIVLLIFLFVKEEWTYDAFHSKSDRIARTWVKEHYQGEVFFNTVTPVILGTELRSNFPELEAVVQDMVQNNIIRKGDFSEEESVHLITPSFLEVFDFPLIEGDPTRALDSPNKLVLTEAMAIKYFGSTDPMGQSLDVQLGDNWQPFTISGIIAAAPSNSSLQYDFLIPFENIKTLFSKQFQLSWTNVYPETYVLFEPGVDQAAFTKKIAGFIDEKVAKIYEPGEFQVGFQPLTDIHLNNEFPAGAVPVSDWRYPYILAAIGLLILILAAINYISLSVGRSLNRAREVGVRKVSGATRPQLMAQFWSEAILLTFIAVIFGGILATLGLPLFNQLAGKSLQISFSALNIGFLITLALSLGLIAGIYPALVLSSFSPMKTLYGKVTNLGGSKHLVLRILVGFQFVLSVGLIICTFVMRQQMTYLQNKNLGFNQEQIISIPYQGAPTQEKGMSDIYTEGVKKAELLRNELKGNQSVAEITVASHVFGTPGWAQVGYTDPNSNKFRQYNLVNIDETFLPTMDIRLKEGRNFSKEITADRSGSLIVNEAMAKAFGWESYLDNPLPAPFEQFRLVGITEDFNFSSLHERVAPLMLTLDQFSILPLMSDMNFGDLPLPKIIVKMKPGNMLQTIEEVKNTWAAVAPDQPFQFAFMDETIDAQYRAEASLSKMLTIATMLAILIAGLGLFGIATISAARRTKEIGVRRVLGASIFQIILLLNRSFTGLVIIATLLATPLAWYAMSQWMDDFAYQVGIQPLVFILSGIAALLLAWLAVSFQALRAARANPVESLQNE